MEAKLSKQIKQQQDTERKSFLNLQKREYKLTKEQMKRVRFPNVLAQYDFKLQNVIRILKNRTCTLLGGEIWQYETFNKFVCHSFVCY